MAKVLNAIYCAFLDGLDVARLDVFIANGIRPLVFPPKATVFLISKIDAEIPYKGISRHDFKTP